MQGFRKLNHTTNIFYILRKNICYTRIKTFSPISYRFNYASIKNSKPSDSIALDCSLFSCHSQTQLSKHVASRCYHNVPKNEEGHEIGFQTTPRKPNKTARSIIKNSSNAVLPYLKLMRVDKPIGSWLLFWPCGWSIAMAAEAGSLPDLKLLALFGLGSFIMRGAGCTINDMWDKNIDSKVSRTKDRPLVTAEISQLEALVFLSAQLGIGLLILLQLNWYCFILGASSLGLVVVYPLMKRVTDWPQLVLGMTFNWGALLGWAAVSGSCDWSVCLPLYAAGICWTIVYDTIYAHQDKVEDALLGIKSTALRFGDNTKLWLSGFGGTMIGGLVLAGVQCQQAWPYYGSVGLVATHLAMQLYSLNINNPSDCGKKFISNHQVGLLLFIGIVISTLVKAKGESESVLLEDKVKNSSR